MASSSIEDMGAGRWRVRWRERPDKEARWRQRQFTVHGTRSDAERYRADVIENLSRHGYHDPEEHAPKIAPPASLLDGLLGFIEAEERLGAKPSTIYTYGLRVGVLAEALYEVTGIPENEPLPVTVLSRSLFSSLIPVLERRGKTVPTRALGILFRAWGWMAGEPAAWPRVPPRPPTPRGFVPKRAVYGRTTAPSLEHADACLRHLRKRSVGLDTLVAAIMQRYTGLRKGQVLTIERDDLDLRRGLLTVMVGKSEQEQADMRTIPLSRHLLAEPLFRKLLGRAPASGRIFRVKNISETIKAAWRDATKAGEVPRHVWAPPNRKYTRPDHAFRAALQGHMEDEHVPKDVVDFLVGHSPGLRGRHYGRDLTDAARAAVDVLPPADWTGPTSSDNVIPLDQSRERAEGVS